jgi:hypothetical protein
MKKEISLGVKGRKLLQLLVDEIGSGRFQKYNPKTFIPYSEVVDRLGMPDPDIYPGRRLQNEGLNELNEWTIAMPEIPKVTGLIVYKDTHIPGEGYPESHGFKSGEDWNDWWLEQTAKAIHFDWSPYLQ